MKIILLHGALGCAADFTALHKTLTNLGFLPETFEFSGHGAKPFSNNFSINNFADELYTVLQQQDPKNTLLFGYSMGGYVILEALAKYSTLNFPFITLATKWQWTEEVAAKEQQLCSRLFLLEKAPAFYEALQKKHANADILLERTADLIHSLGSALKPNIQTIASKALILRGDLDKMVNQQESLELKSLLPHAHYEELPATKHPLDTVDVSVLAAKINEFIAAPV